jgi:N-acetyl-alpha-D-muramate 1-phosphate uridylyltransferase
MTLPVAILAGGLATRLRPVTEKIPKALVQVAGRPFIDHQLELLRVQGYTRAVLCLGYLGEMVEQHLGDGRRFGMALNYVFDGPKLLGTGGALRRALPQLGESFFVLYGDSYLPCDFAAVEAGFRASGMPALMTVLRNDDRWDRSNAVYRDGMVVRYDKRKRDPEMHYIDYGLSAMRAEALWDFGEDSVFDLAEVFTALSRNAKLAGFEVQERFYEIGSPAGLAETETYLTMQRGMGRVQ